MNFHKVASIFPLMEGQEFDSLCQDIAANGLHEAIWTYGGEIIDGRNRYRACETVGIIPSYREYTGTDDKLLAFVISLNLKRRHLNESQRAVIAAKLANMRQGERTDIEPLENLPKVSQTEAAELMNISDRLLRTAKAVEEAAPELMPKVENGEMSLHEAEKKAKQKKRDNDRAELARAGAEVAASDKWNIYLGDIETWQAPRQYDFIITDPPYPREYLPLWEVLARRAKEWLKPNGMLIAMTPHIHMDKITEMMGKHLFFYWVAAYLVPGESAGVARRRINPNFKPLLIYTLNDQYTGRTFSDVFKSEANDKDHHKWGQSESGMYDIISNVCAAGHSILDPFCGAGTTGVAALKHGCFFDGLDIDQQNVNISKGRLNGLA